MPGTVEDLVSEVVLDWWAKNWQESAAIWRRMWVSAFDQTEVEKYLMEHVIYRPLPPTLADLASWGWFNSES